MLRLLIILVLLQRGVYGEIVSIHLSWTECPSTSMHITWVTTKDEIGSPIQYRSDSETEWRSAHYSSQPMPLGLPYLIHHASLIDLIPATRYQFTVGENTQCHYFRTLSDNPHATYRFIVGGDLYCGEGKGFHKMNQMAASLDPQFAVLGGDLAYAHEKLPNREETFEKIHRWIDFLSIWTRDMVTSDHCLIPIIPAIGNHDVAGHQLQTPNASPFFYALFPFPGKKGYRAFDIQEFISLIVLDSGHTHPVDGEQKSWLEETLRERSTVPHKFAIYHVPAYPGRRALSTPVSRTIRTHWSPLFEQFGLSAAFEHHDHTYKRTHPIFNNRVEANGVLYIGDGGWGVRNNKQPQNPQNTWYLAKTAKKSHVLQVTIRQEKCLIEAFDPSGMCFDSIKIIK
jgi:acid phosphatase type 7